MTPTEAARLIIKHTDNRQHEARRCLGEKHGPDIARALLDAEARIAALEAALREAIRQIQCEAFRSAEITLECALTPEGGGK